MPPYPSYPHPKTNKALQSAETGLPGDAKTLIRGSDGLDYENLTARLLGEPAETHRNGFLLSPLWGQDKEARGWYCEAYDAWQARGCSDTECDRAALIRVDRGLIARRTENALRAELADRAARALLTASWG